jgi:hypothetical protein
LTFLCVFALPIVAHAGDSRDGNWWNSLAPAQRVFYALGFFDGQTYARFLMTGALLHEMADPTTGKYDAARSNIATAIGRDVEDDAQKEFGDITVGNLVQGLDHIYRITATHA